MPPYVEQTRDVALKYDHTYVGYKIRDKVHPVFVRGCGGNGTSAMLHVDILNKTATKFESNEIRVNDKNLVTAFPRLGAINLQHAPILFRRVNKRQWRKALNGSVIHIYDPFYEERYRFKLPQVKKVENKSILWAIFNPEYYTRNKAYSIIDSGEKMGAAITPEWFIGVKMYAPGVLLFKDDLSVGILKDKDVVVIDKKAKPLTEQIEGLGYRVEIGK